MNAEFIAMLDYLERERGIKREILIEAVLRAFESSSSSCGLITGQRRANCQRSDFASLRLISMCKSREAPTLFFEADSNAFETASIRISRFDPALPVPGNRAWR